MILNVPKSRIFVVGYQQKLVRVLLRPLFDKELFNMPVEQFLASLRFEQRESLDQLGIEISTFE